MAKIWQLQYRGHLGSINWAVSLHYQTDLRVGSEPSASTVASTVDGLLTTYFRAAMTNSNIVDSLVAREEVIPGSGAVPAEGQQVIALAGTGGTTANDLAPEMCVLVARKTAAAIRSGHGWNHLPPGMNAAHLGAGGDWNAAATMIIAASTFASHLSDTHTESLLGVDQWVLNPVVYSRTRAARGQTDTFNVTAGIRRAHPAWLRSRRT